jgi:uncharacterized coiled-coil protein SlyX
MLTQMRDRILRLRRWRGKAAEARQPPEASVEPMEALEQRVAHLERMVEGLQDAVHREISRTNRELEDLRRRIEPGAMSRALSEEAREHGF